MGVLPVQVIGSQMASKWKLVRVAYIIPVFDEAEGGGTSVSSGRWVESTTRNPESGYAGLLPDALQRANGQRETKGMTGNLLGGPIQRALGHAKSKNATSNTTRQQWVPATSGLSIPYLVGWRAERVSFRLGAICRTFLIVEVELDPCAPVEDVLTFARYQARDSVAAMRLLDPILEEIQPSVCLRGDGGIISRERNGRPGDSDPGLGEGATLGSSVNSRFVVSSVTTAVPSGPGLPPPPVILADHGEWEDHEKWGFFLATHQPHYRKLPADSRERAVRGHLDKMAAWDVRVEPFGTSVVSNDSMLGGAWDQLNLLNASVNPFVELTLLSYWQHACIESFTDQLADQARLSPDTSTKELHQHLGDLRQFGNEYFAFRNSVWFDAVPNQGYWTSYLQMLQERFGDREALERLSVDYADWSTHLANQLALEEAKRKDRNERQIKSFSALGALAALTFALLPVLVEPAKEGALMWGPWLAATFAFVAAGLGAGFFLARRWGKVVHFVSGRWAAAVQYLAVAGRAGRGRAT